LATGSIVLLIGSSAFHGQNGILPWYYTSPLVFAWVLRGNGIAFMVWLIYHYEDYQHGLNTRRRLIRELDIGLRLARLLFDRVRLAYF